MNAIIKEEWYPALLNLSADDKAQVFTAILLIHAANGTECYRTLPNGSGTENDACNVLSPVANAVFSMMRPTLIKNMEAYENKCEKNRKSGALSHGRRDESAPQVSETQVDNKSTERYQTLPNATECNRTEANATERYRSRSNIIECNVMERKEKERESARAKARTPRAPFTQPSVQDVVQYAAEAGISIDAQAFVDYYEANGWKVGSNKMKSWQATVRNWARREKDFATKNQNQNQPSKPLNYVNNNSISGADLFGAISAGLQRAGR